MDILIYNTEWMIFNISLALLGVTFGIIFLHTKTQILRWPIFLLWILFLPNTIYLVTDIQHLPGQWVKLVFTYQLILLIQYLTLILIGVMTFIVSFYFLDKFLSSSKIKKNKHLIITLLIFLNYLIAFGVGLGRIERVHSYEAFIAPYKVISSSIKLLHNPPAIITILLFGTFSNFLYFTCRKSCFKFFKQKR